MRVMKTVFLAWQHPETRRWWPVGRLSKHADKYLFVYTNGALLAKDFSPLGAFPDFRERYESASLFAIFSNRILPKSRPEYLDFIEWLHLKAVDAEPIAILARSGGLRETDSLELFPCPEQTGDGRYQVHFFVRGVRHMLQPSVDDCIKLLQPGTQLYLMSDFQNEQDRLALAVRSVSPPLILGYCPRYFNEDAHKLLMWKCEEDVAVTVERVNLEAPYQLRLLCKLTA